MRKFFLWTNRHTEKQTNGQTDSAKTTCPGSINAGGGMKIIDLCQRALAVIRQNVLLFENYIDVQGPFYRHVALCVCSKCFENTVGKGEIACNEQLLLFLQCFLLV